MCCNFSLLEVLLVDFFLCKCFSVAVGSYYFQDPLPNSKYGRYGYVKKKIGETIIEKDRDDVGGGVGGLLQGPDYISKYRKKSISK